MTRRRESLYLLLTRQQFVDAIDKGFKLVTYKAVKKNAQGVLETTTVATPVP
jgi:hypothetical protein